MPAHRGIGRERRVEKDNLLSAGDRPSLVILLHETDVTELAHFRQETVHVIRFPGGAVR